MHSITEIKTKLYSVAAGAVFCAAFSSRVWGVELKDVRAVIAANAGGINSLEVVVNCRALNRGGNGIVIQNESSRRHMWCDKTKGK